MTFERTFPPQAASVRAVRTFVLELIENLSPQVRETATLLVSELATNVVRHARTAFRVIVRCDDNHLRVSVVDYGGGTPRVQTALSPSEPHGRGLFIVSQFADEFGIDTSETDSTTVWFDLQLEPA